MTIEAAVGLAIGSVMGTWPTTVLLERRQIARILVGALGKDGAREWIAGVERTEFVGSFGLDVSPDVFAHAMLA